MTRWREDTGMATVLVCGAIVVLVTVTVLGMHLGAAVTARYRAEAAADAAALAGAMVVLDGTGTACAAASDLAAQNRAELRDCSLIGADVLVTVAVSARLGPWTGQAAGRARAGPLAAQAP